MRNNAIDNVRGLAMIVIISWHVLNVHSPWTDTWVMPVFFIVMGIFWKQTDLKKLVQKKTMTLVIPWLFFSLPDFFIKIVNHGPFHVLKTVFNPYMYVHAGSWFVVCTLWIYGIAYLIHLIRNKKIRLAVTFGMIVIGYVMSNTHIFGYRMILPLNIHSAICMYLFFEIGRIFKDNIIHASVKASTLLSCIGLLVMSVDIIWLGGIKPFDIIWVSWNQNELWMVLRCVIGCATILYICNLLPKLPIISYIGKYSLIVLLSHFYIINILKSLELSPLTIFIATALLDVVFTYLCIKYIPKLVGVNSQ